MNTEALIRLADKLEGVGPYAEAGPVPATQFDIREWFRWSVSGENVDPTHCGFAACAWGWAATDEWFRQRGLHTRTQGPKTIPAFGYSSGLAIAALSRACRACSVMPPPSRQAGRRPSRTGGCAGRPSRV